MMKTPYYLIDERRLLKNLKKIEIFKKISGAKVLLALKCFSAWCTFDILRKYLDGTTSSSLYEARLGREKFFKEVHAYCVAFSSSDIQEIKKYADKIIFNSFSQLNSFKRLLKGFDLGLRVNPGISYSRFDLADPARKFSRLGVSDYKTLIKSLPHIKGAMFHFNCENDDYDNLSSNIDKIAHKYKILLSRLNWVSLGGGIYLTKKGFPLVKIAKKIKDFSRRFRLQVYLEPGEAVITNAAELVTRVVDLVSNKKNIAIVDSSTEAHMLDLLVYKTPAKIPDSKNGRHEYFIAGRSCLAGDIFGLYKFKKPLKKGSIVRISDAAGYTMVKKNWFNGLQMPAIAVRKLNGKIKLVREFGYKDFMSSLS
ncbi:MAG: carboxynorspermidine decarboxylase [Candidatus Omnitrophica bacterium]|nr:carboxynorspermidine decarboxylase [Candidatus Omnitrophota bacterium]